MENVIPWTAANSYGITVNIRTYYNESDYNSGSLYSGFTLNTIEFKREGLQSVTFLYEDDTNLHFKAHPYFKAIKWVNKLGVNSSDPDSSTIKLNSVEY